MANGQLAGFVEDHAVVTAIEELLTKVLLKAPNRPRECRLRHVQPLGCRGDGPITPHGYELLEFIREMSLPTSFSEMGTDASDETLRAVAKTCILTPGCAKRLSRDEVFQILTECR